MSQKASSKSAKCPLCKKPGTPEFAPFCSAGCKDRDLLQWLGEGYKLPSRIAPGDEDDFPSGEHGDGG